MPRCQRAGSGSRPIGQCCVWGSQPASSRHDPLLAVLEDRLLLIERMRLDLIQRRRRQTRVGELLKMLNREVADTDRAQLAGLLRLDKRAPAGDARLLALRTSAKFPDCRRTLMGACSSMRSQWSPFCNLERQVSSASAVLRTVSPASAHVRCRTDLPHRSDRSYWSRTPRHEGCPDVQLHRRAKCAPRTSRPRRPQPHSARE